MVLCQDLRQIKMSSFLISFYHLNHLLTAVCITLNRLLLFSFRVIVFLHVVKGTAVLYCRNHTHMHKLVGKNLHKFALNLPKSMLAFVYIYFAKIFPNEFLRTDRHTKARILMQTNKRQNCSETTFLIAILAF